jgi:hypothetical protein
MDRAAPLFYAVVLLSVLGVVLGVGCAKSTPQIAEGVPLSFGPTPDFGHRLSERFPIGSPVRDLVAELRAEKFSISDDSSPATATYEVTSLACRDVWKVRWVGEAGKIASISGDAQAICL